MCWASDCCLESIFIKKNCSYVIVNVCFEAVCKIKKKVNESRFTLKKLNTWNSSLFVRELASKLS